MRAVVAAVVLVSACGGDSDGGDVATDEGDQGPLAEYLGFGGDPEEAQAQASQQEQQAQQLIQECMAEQGFEYTPMDTATQIANPLSEAYELPADEFAERYGFGISTLFEEQQAASADFDPATDDPNFARMEEMDEAERQAYEEALYGPGIEFDETLSEEEQAEAMEGFEPEGCQGEAYDEVFNAGGLNELWQSGGLTEMYERYQADPRVQEFWQEWSACMTDEGYEYADMEELYQDLNERMEPVYESMRMNTDIPRDRGRGVATSGSAEESSSDDGSASTEAPGGGGVPDYDEEALAEVMDYELAVAAANQECGGQAPTAGEPEELREIRFEYEQEFVDANREELEAIKAAREGG